MVTSIESDIRSRVEAFAAEIVALVRSSATKMVRHALCGDGWCSPAEQAQPRKRARPAVRG
jgi:hypothetical protein